MCGGCWPLCPVGEALVGIMISDSSYLGPSTILEKTEVYFTLAVRYRNIQ